MAQKNLADLPPLEAWQAEGLRLTLFPSPAAQIGEASWWKDLVGEPAAAKIVQPRIGGHQEEGPFENRKLVLRVEPIRIDWLLAPLDEGTLAAATIPTVGSFPESLNLFVPLMFRWFQAETCPPAQRLAFGATVLLPAGDTQEGYRQISAYLPFQFDAEGSSDFSYQINRPRNSLSGISSLRINRLSKWSVMRVVLGTLAFGPASVGYSARQMHHVCRLELDINTTPDFPGELSREQLPQVFQELVRFAKEIVEKGDIP